MNLSVAEMSTRVIFRPLLCGRRCRLDRPRRRQSRLRWDGSDGSADRTGRADDRADSATRSTHDSVDLVDRADDSADRAVIMQSTMLTDLGPCRLQCRLGADRNLVYLISDMCVCVCVCVCVCACVRASVRVCVYICLSLIAVKQIPTRVTATLVKTAGHVCMPSSSTSAPVRRTIQGLTVNDVS